MQNDISELAGIPAPLSFKDMCAKFDVTPRTLRYYEAIELLFPDRDGTTRTYSARDIARMTLILRGRRFGFSLEEIRQWLLIYDEQGTRAQMESWVNLATRQLETLANERAQLDMAISELEALRDQTANQLKSN